MKFKPENKINDDILHKLGLVRAIGNNSLQKVVVTWPDGTFRWVFSIRDGHPGYLAFQFTSSLKAHFLRVLVVLRSYFPKGSLLGFKGLDLALVSCGILNQALQALKADDWDIFGGSPGVARNLVVALRRNSEVIGYLKVRLYANEDMLSDLRGDCFPNEFSAYEFISTLKLSNTLVPSVNLLCEGIVMSPINGSQLCLIKDSVIVNNTLKEILEKTISKMCLGDYLDQKRIINRLASLKQQQPKNSLFLRYELEEIICCLQRRINRLNYESEIILSLSMIDFTVWNSFRVGDKVGFIDVEFCEQNISLAYDLIHFIWQAEVMLGSENTAQQMGSFAENVIVSNIIQVFSIPESTARIYFDLYLIQSTLRALELYVKQDNLHKQGLLQIKLWLDLECMWLS